jgi:hypothetical protein
MFIFRQRKLFKLKAWQKSLQSLKEEVHGKHWFHHHLLRQHGIFPCHLQRNQDKHQQNPYQSTFIGKKSLPVLALPVPPLPFPLDKCSPNYFFFMSSLNSIQDKHEQNPYQSTFIGKKSTKLKIILKIYHIVASSNSCY